MQGVGELSLNRGATSDLCVVSLSEQQIRDRRMRPQSAGQGSLDLNECLEVTGTVTTAQKTISFEW